jgi:N-terminal domain of anti-restriction factor ArdC/IrrE N-terminal-like domain
MVKTYAKKSKEDKEKEVNELLEKANEGIEKCFTSIEQFKESVNYMSKFYNYSFRNTFLIQEQFKGALAVGSYAFWKEKGVTVNKGEKGIKILVPNRLSDYFINSKGEEVKLSKATPEEKKLIEKGEIEVRKGKLIFNQGYVFEVSQTNAKAQDLPKIFPNRWLDGEVKNYDLMYKAMENIAKKIEVKIIAPKGELGAVKGVSYPLTKEVALNPRNTQLQNVKTLIHELTHAKLHTMETRDNYTTNAKEFQAEMAAYVVCSYFGLDTSEYSFRYISSWTKDVELKDKENLINEVRETVKEYIKVIEDTLINNKDLSLQLEKDKEINLKENMNKEYDKNLYEIKEQEVMNDNMKNSNKGEEKVELNFIKDIFKSLKEKVMTKINNILGKDIEDIDIEKELREIEEHFIEFEDVIENRKISDVLDKKIDYIIGEGITHSIEDHGIKLTEYNIKDIFFFETNRDLFFADGSFVEKGTSFIIDQVQGDQVEIHFESIGEGSKNIYNRNDGCGDDYYFTIEELERFSNPSKEGIERYENLNPVIQDYVDLKEEILNMDKNEFLNDISEYDKNYMMERGISLERYLEYYLNDVRAWDCTNDGINFEVDWHKYVDSYLDDHKITEHEFLYKEFDKIKPGEHENIEPYYKKLYNEYLKIDKEREYSVDQYFNNGKLCLDGNDKFKIKNYVNFNVEIDHDGKTFEVNFSDLLERSSELQREINNNRDIESSLSKEKDDLKKDSIDYDEEYDEDYVEFMAARDELDKDLKNNLEKDDNYMISEKKEIEIRKKIREHEEWINSKGIRGKQLNLENENLSGMMLLNLDLRNANLKNADITQCVIFADLSGANLKGAKIDNTKWTGSNINKMTIEANKLNLIEYQLEQEGCKHTEARKSLKTNKKEKELER